MKQATMTRRTFCKCSALAALSLGLNPWGKLLSSGQADAANPPANYYLARSRELIAAFADSLEGVHQFLSPEIGMLPSRMITQQALANFQALLVQRATIADQLDHERGEMDDDEVVAKTLALEAVDATIGDMLQSAPRTEEG